MKEVSRLDFLKKLGNFEDLGLENLERKIDVQDQHPEVPHHPWMDRSSLIL